MIGNSVCANLVEAALQEPLADGRVRCRTCYRQCVIGDGQTGWCSTRIVKAGRLYTLTYGRVSALACNPIEKKPLYHFYPGSYAITAGSWSCNFACPWCQNWHISKRTRGPDRFITPAEFVRQAHQHQCQGTSISFNEPTLSVEWTVEVFRLARAAGPPLYNTFVTNGYMTADALKRLAEAGLDALNIDIKGDATVYRRYCQAEFSYVLDNCKLARELGLHIEIATLVIPGVNDTEAQLTELARIIVGELGRDVPWHVNAYFPAFKFGTLTTPRATLERAYGIGHMLGLDFVYIGNVNDERANTLCPTCGTRLVRRAGLTVLECRVTPAGTCPSCTRKIPGVGWAWNAPSQPVRNVSRAG